MCMQECMHAPVRMFIPVFMPDWLNSLCICICACLVLFVSHCGSWWSLVSVFTEGDSSSGYHNDHATLIPWNPAPTVIYNQSATFVTFTTWLCTLYYIYVYIHNQTTSHIAGSYSHPLFFPPITMRKVVFPVMAASDHGLLASLQLAVWQANPFSIFAWWGWCWLSLSVKQSPHFHCTVLSHSGSPPPALNPHPAPLRSHNCSIQQRCKLS